MTPDDLKWLLNLADKLDSVCQGQPHTFALDDVSRLRRIAGPEGRLALLLEGIERRLEHCRLNGCHFVPLTHGTWNSEVRCDSCYTEPPRSELWN